MVCSLTLENNIEVNISRELHSRHKMSTTTLQPMAHVPRINYSVGMNTQYMCVHYLIVCGNLGLLSTRFATFSYGIQASP